MSYEGLELKNFQCHKAFTTEFHPGVNVVIGSGDKGKSAIVRALSWVGGKSNPSNLATFGQDSTTGILKVDGKTVKRTKSKTKNTVAIDGQLFEKVGKDGCQPLDTLLNMGDINYQFQHDPAFFLGLTPGMAARELNALANLSCIEDVLSSMKSDLKEASKDVSEAEEAVASSETRCNALLSVAGVKASIDKLMTIEAATTALQANIDRLRELLTEHNSIKVPKEVILDAGMVEKYRNAVTEVDQLAKVIAEANSIKVPNAISVPSFNIEAMDKLKVHINEIVELKKEFLNAKKDIQLAQSELEKASEEYNSIKPETCPLCGKPME